MTQIVTRFAPSPTGLLHAGNYRTAIFSYLYAKKHGGKFILRIEDTDKERSRKDHENNILETLSWLRLPYDAFYRQSDRIEIHTQHLTKLLEENKAYISEEKHEDGKRGKVVRFKNPNRIVSFTDAIRGLISFDTTELGDFVIAKSLDEPLFHLAVVVDDLTMGITHVVRGEDHISNTPRQILITEALGGKSPVYAHLPLILAPDRTKLSKRKGALSLTQYRDEGYLPEAMLNYLALLGWNPGTDREIFSLQELIQEFDLSRIQQSGAIFDVEKLRWFNHAYITRLSPDALYEATQSFLPEKLTELPGFSETRLRAVLPLLSERMHTLREVEEFGGSMTYFFVPPEYDKKGLSWKKDKNPGALPERLEKLIAILSEIEDNRYTAETIKAAVWEYAQKEGRGEVLWPFRYALSGTDSSPDPFTLAGILGKTDTLLRLSKALSLIAS